MLRSRIRMGAWVNAACVLDMLPWKWYSQSRFCYRMPMHRLAGRRCCLFGESANWLVAVDWGVIIAGP